MLTTSFFTDLAPSKPFDNASLISDEVSHCFQKPSKANQLLLRQRSENSPKGLLGRVVTTPGLASPATFRIYQDHTAVPDALEIGLG